MGFSDYLEPEEIIGKLWHRMITRGTETPTFPEAAVDLEVLQRRLGIFFRGLGGEKRVEIKAIGGEFSHERKTWRERIGHIEKEVQRARLDGDNLFLPKQLDVLPFPHLNEGLYFWLTAYSAAAGDDRPTRVNDPFQDDMAFLRFAHQITQRTLKRFPGTKTLYRDLSMAVIETRLERELPEIERELEDCILFLLQEKPPKTSPPEAFTALHTFITGETSSASLPKASRDYQAAMPVVLWGDCIPLTDRQKTEDRDAEKTDDQLPGNPEEEDATDRSVKASRKDADLAERPDSLLLYPFSGMISWLEMLNINRHVEDEDEDAAKKAADEADEIQLGKISKKTATKIKFDLDLAPSDVERERLSGKQLYPEWDYRTKSYMEEHCRVLTQFAEELPEGQFWQPEPASRQRINAVRRRFEALRPKRETLHRQLDGSEFDMDALIRSRCDIAAQGEGSDAIFIKTRPHARDLCVAVLMDTSRSTESWIEGRQVIDIEKEALAALSLGLKASGDDHAIYSFSSVKRDRIYLSTIKNFDEPVGSRVMSRIGALRPGFYTRMGAAVRHVSHILENRANQHRLILIITDGKPNDLDHYEGHYGVEDTRMAILDARRSGLAVFGVTIDARAQSYFPHMFGKGGYSIVSHPDRLTRALPLLFQHLIA